MFYISYLLWDPCMKFIRFESNLKFRGQIWSLPKSRIFLLRIHFLIQQFLYNIFISIYACIYSCGYTKETTPSTVIMIMMMHILYHSRKLLYYFSNVNCKKIKETQSESHLHAVIMNTFHCFFEGEWNDCVRLMNRVPGAYFKYTMKQHKQISIAMKRSAHILWHILN